MKQKTFHTIFIVCCLSIFLVHCDRPTTDSTKLTLQLPTYQKDSLLSACTKCLKALVVNANGSDFKTIVNFQKMDKVETAGTELNSQVEVFVPAGLKRVIQVMALYRLADSTMELQYGTVVADLLSADPPPINMTLIKLAGTDSSFTFKGGSVAGRYMTGTDSGPTGRVIINMSDSSSGMNMDLFSADMINGWFNFFASENFKMSYRFEAGIDIPGFQKVTLNDFMPLTGGTSVSYLARIHRPSSYYRTSDGGTTWNLETEYHDIVYGYFGVGKSLNAVCLEGTSGVSVVMSNLSTSNSGTPLFAYHQTDPAANIYGISGLNSFSNSVACAGTVSSSDRYALNRISVNVNQLNGKGNDTAVSMGGAFTYVISIGSVSKYIRNTSLSYTLQFLPGVFSTTAGAATFDGARIFEKSNAANGGTDDVRCNSIWLSAAGFNESSASSVSIAYAPDQVTFNFVSFPQPTTGYIVCPTSGGNLIGLGGFYVGAFQ